MTLRSREAAALR